MLVGSITVSIGDVYLFDSEFTKSLMTVGFFHRKPLDGHQLMVDEDGFFHQVNYFDSSLSAWRKIGTINQEEGINHEFAEMLVKSYLEQNFDLLQKTFVEVLNPLMKKAVKELSFNNKTIEDL
jgi:hypothetical protein